MNIRECPWAMASGACLHAQGFMQLKQVGQVQ